MRAAFVLLAVVLTATVPASSTLVGAAGADEPSPTFRLESLAVEFVNQMAAEDWVGATTRFDATMQNVAPAEKVAEAWASVTTASGGFRGTRATRVERIDPYFAVFVTCEFAAAVLDVKVVFDPDERIAGFFFVPTQEESAARMPPYAKPKTYVERDVTVGAEGWPLPGTLTLPRGGGPYPAVVLVHGSGPQDRDETIGPNRPFRDLAWGLASRGVAVLRYEKRTKHDPLRLAEERGGLTVKEETVDDAVAAARFLYDLPEIDADRVFVLGHSLGGMLIPRIAAGDDRMAGFICMAGPTRSLAVSVVEQFEYLAMADGWVDEDEQRGLDEIKGQVAVLASEDLNPDTDPDTLPFGVPATYWLDLRGYDPAAEAAAITRPLLILQGKRDYQVTLTDYQRWVDALSARDDVTFKLYPTLNHLFMHGTGPSTPAEYQTPGNVDVAVIRDLAGWVKGVQPE